MLMSDNNPYVAPDADLSAPNEPGIFALDTPRGVSIGNGVNWIGEGFGYFKASPGPWLLAMIVGFVILIALSIVPFINILAGFISYVWLGGFMLGLKAQYDGEKFDIKYLFAGFQNKFGPLLLLSVVVAVIHFVVWAAILGSMAFQLMSVGGAPDHSSFDFTSLLLRILIGISLTLPLVMAAWFAPALIVLHDVQVFDAMRLSFAGCLKNVLPFLLYGIVALLFLFVAALPLGLGLLVVVPLLFGSIFASYRDIFVREG